MQQRLERAAFMSAFQLEMTQNGDWRRCKDGGFGQGKAVESDNGNTQIAKGRLTIRP
jgi:hypothetical protein